MTSDSNSKPGFFGRLFGGGGGEKCSPPKTPKSLVNGGVNSEAKETLEYLPGDRTDDFVNGIGGKLLFDKPLSAQEALILSGATVSRTVKSDRHC